MRDRKRWKGLVALAMSAAMLFSQTVAYAQEGQPVEQGEVVQEVRGQEADLTISSARELNEFAQKVNNGNTYEGKLIKLTQNIQFDGVTVNNFTPIGGADYDHAFAGTFDGCGYTISGIDVTNTTFAYIYIGLFGYIGVGGVVKNVTVTDSMFDSIVQTGSIAGLNYGTIDNCHNRNTKTNAGGIVGTNRGTIVNCSSTGMVVADGDAGGIAGRNVYGNIYNCCNMGVVQITSEDKWDSAGGIVGLDGYGGSDTSGGGTIQNCYNTGSIIYASGEWHGGLIGYASGSIVANSFCSEESDAANFGVMNGTEKNNKALPASEMQTESFVSQLNANRGSNADWLEWEIRPDESPYPLPVKLVNLSECGISLSSSSVVYDGTAKRPEVVVTYDGKTLENGADYALIYQNNTNAGTATVVIEGLGRYIDSATLTFSITKADLSQCTVSFGAETMAYTGNAVIPKITVSNNGRTLAEGTDYTAVCSNNTNPGTAQVILTGAGNYTGTVTKTFTIACADIARCTVSLNADSYVYNGTAKTPSVTVKDGTNTLKSGTDYTVTYADNTNAGTARVTVTGRGNYTGTVTKNFTIQKAAQTFSYTKSYSKAYGSKAFTLNAKLKAGNGKLTYATSNKKVATVKNGKVTVTGTGAATITVKAAGTANYNAASVTVTIKASPAKQTLKSLKTVKGRKLTVTWKKDTRATGYQIQCSTDKNFKKGVKTATVSKYKTVSKTITKLTKGKRYYVRVRSYKSAKVSGKTQKLYGAWSGAKRSGSIKK